jgi:asparagine synthetase B (glutamine-hydrolysing)
LIENIHKLIATRYLEIDWTTHSIKIKKMRAERRKTSRRTAKEALIKSIDNSINNLYKSLKDDNISLTLTGGWDSNYILFNFCKLTDSQIKAVTIDGGGAKNEVPAARLLLENYNNVDHLTGEVEENSTNLLPDMVWRYDGYIFQEGMFLRYELAKILSEVGSKLVVLAACADQILYQRPIIVRTYKKLEQLYIIKNYRGERLSRHEFKFRRGSITPSNNEVQDLEIEYLLKMHDVMNNSFGVQSIYPFLDKNILSISKALGIRNRRKQFYKSELRRILGSEITQHMTKSGSVVDTYQMFKSNENKLIGIIDTQLAGEILTKSQIDELKRKPSLYHLFIMQLVYIYLFYELFISGYYDVDFGKTNLNLALDSFSF